MNGKHTNFLTNIGYRGVWEQRKLQGSDALKKKKSVQTYSFRKKGGSLKSFP